LTVAFRKDAPLSELESIKGIKKVEQQREGRLRLFYEPDQDPVDEIVRRSAENGWGLCELRPGRVSLEEIFLHLTTEDKASDEEAA
jgi:ABC-2 type transport system ATP-binding protein